MARFVPLLRSAAKVALAASVALLAAQGLGLEPGWFAVVASIMVMQASLGGSVRSAWARVAGTALGALIGVAFETGLGDGVASVALAAAVSGTLLQALGLAEAVRVGTVTAPIVMLAPASSAAQGAAGLGLERTLETVLGALVGVGVALLVWPAPARRDAHRLLVEGLGDLRELLLLVAAPLLPEAAIPGEAAVEAVRERCREHMARATQLLDEMKAEPPPQPGDGAMATLLAGERRLLIQTYAATLPVADFADHEDPLRQHLRPFLARLVQAGADSLEDVQAALRDGRDPRPLEGLEAAEKGVHEALMESRKRNLPREASPDEAMKVLGTVNALVQVAERIVGLHAAVAAWRGTQARRR